MGGGDNACLVGTIRIIIDMIKNIRKTIDSVGMWIAANQTVFLAFVATAVIVEVYVFSYSVDIRLFGVLLLYWWLSRIGKLASARVFQLCLVLLAVMFVSYLTGGVSTPTERLAVCFVLFFALGIIQQWREIAS